MKTANAANSATPKTGAVSGKKGCLKGIFLKTENHLVQANKTYCYLDSQCDDLLKSAYQNNQSLCGCIRCSKGCENP